MFSLRTYLSGSGRSSNPHFLRYNTRHLLLASSGISNNCTWSNSSRSFHLKSDSSQSHGQQTSDNPKRSRLEHEYDRKLDGAKWDNQANTNFDINSAHAETQVPFVVQKSTSKKQQRQIFKRHLSVREQEFQQKCSWRYRTYSKQERHLQNFYIQLMRKFTGKSAGTIKYLQKRKRKRKEFQKRLNSYDYKQYEFEARHRKDGCKGDAVRFSDDEDEDLYNYYTDEEADENESEEGTEEELQSYYRVRAFLALMLPLSVSAAIGVYLAKKQLDASKDADTLTDSTKNGSNRN